MALLRTLSVTKSPFQTLSRSCCLVIDLARLGGEPDQHVHDLGLDLGSFLVT